MKASKEIKKDEIKSNSEDVSKDIANIDHTNNKKLKKINLQYYQIKIQVNWN